MKATLLQPIATAACAIASGRRLIHQPVHVARLADVPVLAELAREIAARRAERKHARAGIEVIERLLLDRIDAEARRAAVRREHHLRRPRAGARSTRRAGLRAAGSRADTGRTACGRPRACATSAPGYSAGVDREVLSARQIRLAVFDDGVARERTSGAQKLALNPALSLSWRRNSARLAGCSPTPAAGTSSGGLRAARISPSTPGRICASASASLLDRHRLGGATATTLPRAWSRTRSASAARSADRGMRRLWRWL